MMRVLAHASSEELAAAQEALAPLPAFVDLRKPEIGLVMLRGRVGGDGAPFNIGEATVTRAAVRLATGEVGFAYILGRDPAKARAAALIDALWQSPERRDSVEARVIAPLAAAAADRLKTMAARTAATRVEFFTLVRGEDT
jgi:alpha-D-ribose 1-methylphosphonate 5-triphosphate synthase subunit PhnG